MTVMKMQDFMETHIWPCWIHGKEVKRVETPMLFPVDKVYDVFFFDGKVITVPHDQLVSLEGCRHNPKQIYAGDVDGCKRMDTLPPLAVEDTTLLTVVNHEHVCFDLPYKKDQSTLQFLKDNTESIAPHLLRYGCTFHIRFPDSPKLFPITWHPQTGFSHL